MKTFKFVLDPNPQNSSFQKIRKGIKSFKEQKDLHIMRCSSYEAMTTIMSGTRMALYSIILNEKPSSLYELAKIAKKDQSNVLRDVRFLEGIGLIKLSTSKDGKKEKLTPIALYDKVILECESSAAVAIKRAA